MVNYLRQNLQDNESLESSSVQLAAIFNRAAAGG
jgi:flagellum-specific ATP synthase